MNMYRTRILALAAAVLMGASTGVLAQQMPFEQVDPPAPTQSGDAVEVVEFFWYGCPHCFALQPHIEAWQKRKPANVTFRLVAAPLNPAWTIHSRAYYAAELLGEVERFHNALFDQIHKGKNHMRRESDIVEFAASLGIDPDKFREAMNSFAVETNMRRAMQLADAYRISGVPTIGVNGKFKITASMAGGYPQMIEVLDRLLAREGG